MSQRKIAFIGGGNMASAIISGLIASGYDKSNITVSVPSETSKKRLSEQFGIQATSDNILATRNADVIILAVKPQLMKEVCAPIQEHVDVADKLFLTIAAGTQVQFYKKIFKLDGLKIIRVMPNTPSLVGQGVSGLFAESDVSKEDKDFAENLMGAVGKTVWVDKEEQINNIIAIAGSAPGYFFLFLDAMQRKAEALGFEPEQARALILQTAKGVVSLAEHEKDLAFLQLRNNVTSKGGTTIEAVNVFEKNGIYETVDEAMQAAIDRAGVMEKDFLKD
ncbi:pyrroline-5-carboxylate reductase [Acinetobacter sp. ESL0695]|uniref:pyrroline-5-carboxylate reductase n=1 Tax=Acinetobacter sp. ESL0695 TaxID=2983215 RepID=UPI0023F39C8C|nr:pyrroline-5-carboxylate reductase [Acinetobacter sp. ESL0695]WEV47997.1 pyrroline-5-carboxylate reductase [Acinetobacter sp. ESL0695]